jgi:hypothetical protein
LIRPLAHAGVVASISYTHKNRQDPGAPVGTQGLPAPATALGNQYQLVAAVTRIKVMLWGEGFRDFMQGRTVRRSSLQFYFDLFLYQPPNLRYSGLPHFGMRVHVYKCECV